MSGHAMLAFAFLAGAGFGAVVAWAWFERTAPRKIVLKVDPELVSNMTDAMVMEWLDRRGLMWMPKGVEMVVKGKTR